MSGPQTATVTQQCGDTGLSTYQELRRTAEFLARPIEFSGLIAAGVPRQQGEWYEVLGVSRLPEHARVKIREVRAPNLVKFRKPSKKLRRLLQRGC